VAKLSVDREGRALEALSDAVRAIASVLDVDPARLSGKLMPFWSAREIGTYAIDPVGTDYLHRGLGHALLTALLLVLATVGIAAVRLRQRGHITRRRDLHDAPR
jgi:hypothetical protein